MFDPTPAKIFSGRASQYLAEEICKHFGQPLGKASFIRFADGEFETCLEETVRGKFVFIIQSTFSPIDNLFELLMMIDSARRASAYKIVAVIPYFGYARQDRKDKPRVSIGAKLVSNLLMASGIDRVITVDLHADQIQGFFDVPVDHLYASTLFLPYIQSLNLENLVIGSPDTGGSKRANAYAKYLGKELVICHKFRKEPNAVAEMTVIGEVKDKNVILIDDIIDTGGSIAKAGQMIMERGARSVRVCATHAVFSNDAVGKLDRSPITEVIVTDTIPLKRSCPKISVISISELMADVIHKVHDYQSISGTFII